VISGAGPDRAFSSNDRVLDVANWWDFRVTGDVTNQRWDLVYITDHNGFSYFQVVNKHSGKCLDKSMDAGNVDGAQVYQYSCSNSSANQLWRIDWECDFRDFFQLHDYADNRCLDIRNRVDANDASLQVWTCGFHAWNQEWYYTTEST